MLIRQAEIWQHGLADVRVDGGRIVDIGLLHPLNQEMVIDARGGALFPGLHDHHIHLAATAVAEESLHCGPPAVRNREQLRLLLRQYCSDYPDQQGWLRGIAYHESVAGMLDAATLDAWISDRPVRIQHRSGRMWFLNSAAIAYLLDRTDPPIGMERDGAGWTGRLFDEDQWMRQTLAGNLPCFWHLSKRLLGYGICGVTDMTPSNDPWLAQQLAQQQANGVLRQNVILAGQPNLMDGDFGSMIKMGPTKLHLHEQKLPDFDQMAACMADSHAQGRAVAVHCTTEVELVFALAGLRAAGVIAGDRIEHAGIATDELIAQCADLGLAVVSQPHFIAERGDQYLRDVETHHHPHLYRLAAFLRADVPLAGGSDAPYGSCDPWAAMRAAIHRQTPSGEVIGDQEALTPEQAMGLYLRDPLRLNETRQIAIGAPADLLLLDRPWHAARTDLTAQHVKMTVMTGSIAYQRVD